MLTNLLMKSQLLKKLQLLPRLIPRRRGERQRLANATGRAGDPYHFICQLRLRLAPAMRLTQRASDRVNAA